jgi:hypothetical protein
MSAELAARVHDLLRKPEYRTRFREQVDRYISVRLESDPRPPLPLHKVPDEWVGHDDDQEVTITLEEKYAVLAAWHDLAFENDGPIIAGDNTEYQPGDRRVLWWILQSHVRDLLPQFLPRLEHWYKDVEANLASTTIDGPTVEGFMYFDGRPYRFSPLQWRLIKGLWGKGSVSVEDLAKAVYEGEDVIEEKLRKLVHDTNTRLLKHKLPFEIISPMPSFYVLKRLPPVTPQVTEK